MRIYYEIYSKLGKGLTMSMGEAKSFKKAKALKRHLESLTGDKLFIDKVSEDDNGNKTYTRRHKHDSEDVLIYTHNPKKSYEEINDYYIR